MNVTNALFGAHCITFAASHQRLRMVLAAEVDAVIA
jgi:hypothetical protein